MYKSQNNETQLVLNYFGEGFKGSLIEIGANDGITLSNSYDLIKLGWSATLVEPSSVFSELHDLHKDNDKVKCLNVAIGEIRSTMTLFESGAHVANVRDKALVSTLDFEETLRWRKKGVQFSERKVGVVPFTDIKGRYDFISIDVEGFEFEILRQIDLNECGCKMICIEWNSVPYLANLFTEYISNFGLKEIHRNAENLVFSLV